LFIANAIEKIKDVDEYRVKYHLYLRYKEYFDKLEDEARIVPKVKIPERHQQELMPWIDGWTNLNNLKIDLENKHFYLGGRDLNFFSQEVIRKVRNEVLIANPFVSDCSLSETLREASKNEATATLIRRQLDKEKNKKYSEILHKEGVKIYFNEKGHSKIIIIYRTLAIISSMNFTIQSSGGQSWEVGIVTIDSSVVEKIINSILNLIEKPESVLC